MYIGKEWYISFANLLAYHNKNGLKSSNTTCQIIKLMLMLQQIGVLKAEAKIH